MLEEIGNNMSLVHRILFFLFLLLTPLFSADQEDVGQIIIPFKRFGLEVGGCSFRCNKVEVWSTLDKGLTWKLYSEINSPSSPIPIKVSEDGVYGMKLVYFNNKEMTGKRPVSGDLPSVYVVVDTAKPVLRVNSNKADGIITLRWSCSDKNLSKKPVKLMKLNIKNNEWEVFREGLKCEGLLSLEYNHKTKYKMIAEDLAGNESQKNENSIKIIAPLKL